MDFKQHISWVYKQGGDSRLRGMTQYSVRMEHLEWFVKPGGSHTFNVDEATEAYTEAEFAEALAKGCGRVTAESLQRGRPPRNWWDIPRENSRSKERQYGLHPSMKPLKICERLVLVHSNPGDTVVVPFGGSGSECVSTAALGRTLYAYETCDEYYQIILRRMHGHGLLPSGYPVPPPLVKGGAAAAAEDDGGSPTTAVLDGADAADEASLAGGVAPDGDGSGGGGGGGGPALQRNSAYASGYMGVQARQEVGREGDA